MPSWGTWFPYPPVVGKVGPGLEFETALIETRGREYANANLSNGLRRIHIGGANLHISYLSQWEAFQRLIKGRQGRFLFRLNSPLFEMTDSLIGTGDGVTTAFQLKKNFSYAYGPANETSEIVRLPVHDYPPMYLPNSPRKWLDTEYVSVYLDGVLKTLTTHYSVQREGGLITFATPPAVGQLVTATCKFWILARQSQDFNPVEATSEAMVAFAVPDGIFITEPRGGLT